MVIDVGAPCVSRAFGFREYTWIDKANPANATGVIDHIDFWCNLITGDVDIAAFTEGAANTFSTNGVALGLTVVNGDQDFDAPGDFAPFNITLGDYIGEYGLIAMVMGDVAGGLGNWYKGPADWIPCTSQDFILLDNRAISVYATGVESGPPANPYPTSLLKKGFISGYHCFESAYINAKVGGFDPLKLPDGTVF